MAGIINSRNIRLYGYVIILALLAGAWRAGEAINRRLAATVVLEAPKAATSAEAITEKNFYPVWVKQAVATPPPAEEKELDALFRRPEEPKLVIAAPEPPEPNYEEMFKRSARIDGVADDGVFLNSSFYKAGAAIDELAMVTPRGNRIIPQVDSVSNDRVTFRISNHRLVFMFRRGE